MNQKEPTWVVVPYMTMRRRGAEHPLARLTPADVEAIRTRYARKEASQVQLAAEYGVGQTTISAIILRKTWKRTDDDDPKT